MYYAPKLVFIFLPKLFSFFFIYVLVMYWNSCLQWYGTVFKRVIFFLVSHCSETNNVIKPLVIKYFYFM